MKDKSTIIIIAVVVIIAIIAIVAIVMLGSKEDGSNTKNETTTSSTKKSKSKQKEETDDEEIVDEKEEETDDADGKIDYAAAAEKQMAMPEEGETIAIMHIKDYGDITFKFFDDVAPKAVENFLTHSKEGYYDGLTFHRVIDEFMIQGGDPLGTGTGGESIWGEGFGTELDESLVPYRGSLCMAMSSLPNSIGSQFFITQANYSEQMNTYMKSSGYDSELLNQYKKYGGYLSLYMQYTVFGQVIDGMDVVDKIAAVKTNSNDKPLTDVIIESIEVKEYHK